MPFSWEPQASSASAATMLKLGEVQSQERDRALPVRTVHCEEYIVLSKEHTSTSLNFRPKVR
jgi:hypothetical protein